MVICGSSMLEFSVGKDMEKKYDKGDSSREGTGTFVSNTNCQGIEN